jgi:Zn-dependent peptidase ImmA (M78 family)
MFTLAHELAHLWLGRSAAFDLRDLQPADDAYEQACNRIAAEFLVPSSLLITLWPDIAANKEAFQHIARRFKVSEIVAARRVFDLGLIGRDTFFGFYREWQQSEYIKNRSTRGGGDYYMNQNLRIGRRFGEALVQSVQEGKTSYTEAYRLSDLNRMTFQRYADDKFGRRV